MTRKERDKTMSLPHSPSVNPQRRTLIKAAAASVAVGAGSTLAFPAIAQAKPFAGVKLRGAAYQHGFFNILRKYIPEFERRPA
jgi:multiple sugar transport system substrate-binding protein